MREMRSKTDFVDVRPWISTGEWKKCGYTPFSAKPDTILVETFDRTLPKDGHMKFWKVCLPLFLLAPTLLQAQIPWGYSYSQPYYLDSAVAYYPQQYYAPPYYTQLYAPPPYPYFPTFPYAYGNLSSLYVSNNVSSLTNQIQQLSDQVALLQNQIETQAALQAAQPLVVVEPTYYERPASLDS